VKRARRTRSNRIIRAPWWSLTAPVPATARRRREDRAKEPANQIRSTRPRPTRSLVGPQVSAYGGEAAPHVKAPGGTARPMTPQLLHTPRREPHRPRRTEWLPREGRIRGVRGLVHARVRVSAWHVGGFAVAASGPDPDPARHTVCMTCLSPGSFMIERIRSAVADGVLPTLTPAASRACFLWAAVPEEPDTMAPA
jgi:hypothetical protein